MATGRWLRSKASVTGLTLPGREKCGQGASGFAREGEEGVVGGGSVLPGFLRHLGPPEHQGEVLEPGGKVKLEVWAGKGRVIAGDGARFTEIRDQRDEIGSR